MFNSTDKDFNSKIAIWAEDYGVHFKILPPVEFICMHAMQVMHWGRPHFDQIEEKRRGKG